MLTITILLLVITLTVQTAETLPDSLLTTDKAIELSTSDKDKALDIIKTIRKRQLAPKWDIAFSEGLIYYNGYEEEKAEPCFERALKLLEGDKEHGHERMDVLRKLIDNNEYLHRMDEMVRYAERLMAEAKVAGDKYFESYAHHAIGKRLFFAGDQQQGIDECQRAVTLAEQSTTDSRYRTLCDYHRTLLYMYEHSDLPDLALEELNRWEAVLHEMQTKHKETVPHQAEGQLYMLYAARAAMLCDAGRIHEADADYAAWLKLPRRDPSEETRICNYLIKRGRYAEAYDIYQQREAQLKEKDQYYNHSMRILKRNMAEVLLKMNRAQEAMESMQESYAINDTLHVREAEAKAQELAAEHHDLEQQSEIARQRLWIIALVCVIALTLVAGLIYRIMIVRRRKDKVLAEVVNEMTRTSSPPLVGEGCPKGGVGIDMTDTHRFRLMDEKLERSCLYTQPDLSRDVLCGLMGVGKNDFARIIREQSGCQNMNGYLNRKRVRHAAQQMREHPDYTIEGIMRDSGFKSAPTFYKAFREIYGQTPSDYRKSLSADNS